MKKSTGRQYIELFYSLQIINDSLSLISLGKKYHVIPIAGQLRAILIKDKQTPVPLYYAIQKILEVKQYIYLSTIPEKIKISKDCECYFNVMNVSLERDKLQILYLQLIIPQYFISNKSGIWSLSLIVHSKG